MLAHGLLGCCWHHAHADAAHGEEAAACDAYHCQAHEHAAADQHHDAGESQPVGDQHDDCPATCDQGQCTFLRFHADDACAGSSQPEASPAFAVLPLLSGLEVGTARSTRLLEFDTAPCARVQNQRWLI